MSFLFVSLSASPALSSASDISRVGRLVILIWSLRVRRRAVTTTMMMKMMTMTMTAAKERTGGMTTTTRKMVVKSSLVSSYVRVDP